MGPAQECPILKKRENGEIGTTDCRCGQKTRLLRRANDSGRQKEHEKRRRRGANQGCYDESRGLRTIYYEGAYKETQSSDVGGCQNREKNITPRAIDHRRGGFKRSGARQRPGLGGKLKRAAYTRQSDAGAAGSTKNKKRREKKQGKLSKPR